MPPEQKQPGSYVNLKADIYSLGAVIWEIVAGKQYWNEELVTPPSVYQTGMPKIPG